MILRPLYLLVDIQIISIFNFSWNFFSYFYFNFWIFLYLEPNVYFAIFSEFDFKSILFNLNQDSVLIWKNFKNFEQS